jgi:hypothetical protein
MYGGIINLILTIASSLMFYLASYMYWNDKDINDIVGTKEVEKYKIQMKNYLEKSVGNKNMLTMEKTYDGQFSKIYQNYKFDIIVSFFKYASSLYDSLLTTLYNFSLYIITLTEDINGLKQIYKFIDGIIRGYYNIIGMAEQYKELLKLEKNMKNMFGNFDNMFDKKNMSTITGVKNNLSNIGDIDDILEEIDTDSPIIDDVIHEAKKYSAVNDSDNVELDDDSDNVELDDDNDNVELDDDSDNVELDDDSDNVELNNDDKNSIVDDNKHEKNKSEQEKKVTNPFAKLFNIDNDNFKQMFDSDMKKMKKMSKKELKKMKNNQEQMLKSLMGNDLEKMLKGLSRK